jgi:alpha,alpha-trehalase
VTSVYCSWYATGGSLPGLLPRLSNSTLNLTDSTDQNGHLFERFSALDVDSSRSGGEYQVQAGFGWTNGVLLWAASEFKEVLDRPSCPNVTQEFSTAEGNTQGGSSGAMARVTRRGVLSGVVSGVVVGLLVMFGMLL